MATAEAEKPKYEIEDGDESTPQQGAAPKYEVEGEERPDLSQNPPSGVTKPNIKMHQISYLGDPSSEASNIDTPSTLPGASEGTPLAEGLADWDRASFGKMGEGASDVAHGNVAKGSHKIMSGFGAATLPVAALTAPAMLGNPMTTARVLGGAYAAGKGLRAGTQALGGTPDQADVAEDVGNLAGGVMDAKAPKVIGSMVDSMGLKSPPFMQRAAQKLVGPMVYENVGETARDNSLGANPERGIVDEGHVGFRDNLPGKMNTRIAELKNAANQILDNHPNSRQLINAEPIVDSVIDAAVNEAQKGGESSSRLEALRTALKTKYGKLQGTPREMNDLKSDIQDQAMNRGAYKNTQPQEASVSRALGQIASRVRSEVDAKVPEAAQINQRIQDQIDARSGIQKNIDKARGEDIFKETASNTSGPVGKIMQRTLGSAPVRTGLARALNFGHVQGVPDVTPYQGPRIAGLLNAKPTPLGPSTATNPTSAPPPVEGTTRPMRKNLLLPEHATAPVITPPPTDTSGTPESFRMDRGFPETTRPMRKNLLLPERAGGPHMAPPTFMGGAEGFPGYGPKGPFFGKMVPEDDIEMMRRGGNPENAMDAEINLAKARSKGSKIPLNDETSQRILNKKAAKSDLGLKGRPKEKD
jgi:hypothetical protein